MAKSKKSNSKKKPIQRPKPTVRSAGFNRGRGYKCGGKLAK